MLGPITTCWRLEPHNFCKWSFLQATLLYSKRALEMIESDFKGKNAREAEAGR